MKASSPLPTFDDANHSEEEKELAEVPLFHPQAFTSAQPRLTNRSAKNPRQDIIDAIEALPILDEFHPKVLEKWIWRLESAVHPLYERNRKIPDSTANFYEKLILKRLPSGCSHSVLVTRQESGVSDYPLIDGLILQLKFELMPAGLSGCLFCDGSEHTTLQYDTVTDANSRLRIVRKKKCCFNCLRDDHFVDRCQSLHNCHQCGRRHHRFLHGAKGLDG